MARTVQPQVSDGQLTGAGAGPIAVGSGDWYAWLAADTTHAFAYRSAAGSFSARRERQRNGLYWYAYHRRSGTLRKAYLGRAPALTPERLATIAAALSSPAAPAETAQPAGRGSQPAPTPAPLLATKLAAPLPRPALLVRPRLAALLNDALRCPLMLVCAPAGWGKTTLVSGWLAGVAERTEGQGLRTEPQAVLLGPQSSALSTRFAWLSLDAADSDPARFWAYLAAALDQLLPGVSASLDALRYTFRPAEPEALAHTIAHALTSRTAPDAPQLLVLDDYHLIEAPSIHQGLALLLDHLPPWLHLLICTRADPPLPLSRLRARGQLAELRAADLRFDDVEATAFVRDVLGLSLSPAALARLNARAEGWAAGLQLAALSWQGEPTDTATPSARYALEYLADEVLDRQPAPLRRFLLHTAVLDRMCGPLCDAVLQTMNDERRTMSHAAEAVEEGGSSEPPSRSGLDSSFSSQPSALSLQEIERANLFLVPLDSERRWYRYHHLFADMLRERLQREAGALVPELHRRAARWFHSQSLCAEAIGHALAAADYALASDVIAQSVDDLLWSRGEVHTLLGWLRALPHEQRIARPRIAVAYGWALLATLRLAELELLLAAAEGPITRSGDAASRGELLAIRSFLSQLMGDPERALGLARDALSLLPDDRPTVRAMVDLNIANAYTATGDVRRVAAVAAQTAVHLPGAIGMLLATSAAANSLMMRAQLPQALDLAERMLRSAADGGFRHNPAIGTIMVEVAAIRYEWDQLDAAEAALAEALDLGQHWWNSDILINGYNLRGRLALARGDRAEAAQWYERADQLLLAYNTPAIAQLVRDNEALWRLALGDVAAAEAWEQTCGLSLADQPNVQRYYGYVALVRLSLARGSAAATLRTLGRLLAQADAGDYAERALDLLKLQALAHAALGDHEQALAAMARALALARPNGHVRSFVDEGAPMAVLLRQVRSAGIGGRYVARLLTAFPAATDAPGVALPEPLTAREGQVLRHLADHRPLAAIAAALVVAPSTLRSHVKHLYAKLGAHSRLEALARARALGLLGDA